MIVIGLDVHKQSVTAVAVDEAGRPLAETLIQVGSDDLLGWAAAADSIPNVARGLTSERCVAAAVRDRRA